MQLIIVCHLTGPIRKMDLKYQRLLTKISQELRYNKLTSEKQQYGLKAISIKVPQLHPDKFFFLQKTSIILHQLYLSHFQAYQQDYLLEYTFQPLKYKQKSCEFVSASNEVRIKKLAKIKLNLLPWVSYYQMISISILIQIQKMCKKSFVTLRLGRRQYRLFTDDIQQVHRIISKKRPPLPAYECVTADEVFWEQRKENNNCLTL